ncbi:Crp/Fnr family transcriptional regulator [Pelagibacterium sp. H642]|uniref:Crp/Fnr family transcriptional regulator n=1 Tax=Pelagibacterium sp. H642 TaxID=1881069 RepID=UPI0028157D10|nr:Crp/Fnr family transcriptional regulator [Pelagibacterium sp. H642]WMT89594.1 Crp/Fnr family transcriptional regulator [Pelagibacterium sp. H642]
MGRQDIHNFDMPVLCRNCEVRHGGLCGALDADQLLTLSRHTRMVRRPAGDELIADDTEITRYANLMRGVVKLSKMLEDGRQQMVGLQFAPDFLGRLYATQNRVTAEAASEVELCMIPREALEKLVAEHPALEHRLLEQTLRELDEARDWMVTLGRKTAGEKVASFLYMVALHIDPLNRERKTIIFELPLSRADIADFLGLTIETVSRQLTLLRKDGVISVENSRRFTIPDLTRLQGRCG